MISSYDILKSFANLVKILYFKKVHISGIDNIPLDGPVILCGNHANQFIDPIMIASNVNRQVSFTMAASSFKKPVIGQISRALKSIPVKRPEDSKVKGKGKVYIEKDKLIIKGNETKFKEETKDFVKGWMIMIKNKMINVKNVIDDSTIEIVENKEIDLSSLIGKDQLEYFVSKIIIK